MSHLYKESIWQSATGRWYCADVEDLGHGSAYWWIPCRMLEISPTDFILLLKDKFNASNFSFNKEKNFLNYSWEKEADARKYKNWINAEARKRNFII